MMDREVRDSNVWKGPVAFGTDGVGETDGKITRVPGEPFQFWGSNLSPLFKEEVHPFFDSLLPGWGLS